MVQGVEQERQLDGVRRRLRRQRSHAPPSRTPRHRDRVERHRHAARVDSGSQGLPQTGIRKRIPVPGPGR